MKLLRIIALALLVGPAFGQGPPAGPPPPPPPPPELNVFILQGGYFLNPTDPTQYVFVVAEADSFTRHYSGSLRLNAVGLTSSTTPITSDGAATVVETAKLTPDSIAVEGFNGLSLRANVGGKKDRVRLKLPGELSYTQQSPVFLNPGPAPASVLLRDLVTTGSSLRTVRSVSTFDGATAPAAPAPDDLGILSIFPPNASAVTTTSLPIPDGVAITWRHTRFYNEVRAGTAGAIVVPDPARRGATMSIKPAPGVDDFWQRIDWP